MILARIACGKMCKVATYEIRRERKRRAVEKDPCTSSVSVGRRVANALSRRASGPPLDLLNAKPDPCFGVK